MKKWLTRIVAIVAILTLSVFCLTACGDSDKGGVEGTYKIQTITISDGTNSTVYEHGDAVPEMQLDELTANTMVIELKADGVAVVTGSTAATWVVDADDSTKITITMTAPYSQTMNAVAKDGVMTVVLPIGPDTTATYVFNK